MTGGDIHPAHWQLHGMLIRRIAGVAVLAAAVLGALVYLLEQGRMREVAVDLAVQRAAQFSALAGDAIAVRDDVQARLDRFAVGRLPQRDGRIVAARITDAAGAPLADFLSPDYALRAAAAAFLAESPPTAGEGAEPRGRAVEIAAVRHFFVQLPMQGADGRALGRLTAVFAPSAVYLAELQHRIWRTAGAAIAVVLLTAAILYPLILRLMRRVTALSAKLLDANLEMLSVLGSAIAKRDTGTDAHNYRVTIYSVRLAEAAGFDPRAIQALIKGAFLHDVGKIGIPDHILLKPGKLTDEEYAEMKKHVAYGLDIVRRAAWLADAGAVVGCHHERFDGGGYDGHIKADAIPVIARVFMIADVFDALTSRRPYKEPLAFDAAMGILEHSRGTHFDPLLLDAFADIARPLHDRLANRDDDHPRQELQRILTRYFKQDLEALLI